MRLPNLRPTRFDRSLRRALTDELQASGWVPVDRTWGVGGSQECETGTFTRGQRTIVVTSETYIGLYLEGDADVVSELARRVRHAAPTGP